VCWRQAPEGRHGNRFEFCREDAPRSRRLRDIFDHARNAVVATVVVAAGLEATKRVDAIDLMGLFAPLSAAYVVAGVGCALIVLYFIDGLRKLAKLRWHIVLQIALGIAYLFVSLRIVQLVIFIRTHPC
jgi:hypothetical protein